ncbi:MAG: HD domain-containing protein [Campylobacterota bacterium]|nr:HD domain-containing protein [Campylobacterota bacterium]
MANLHQIIYALSDALDLVGVDDVYHGKRVAYMALETARELNLRKDDYIDIFHASLMHDCGVSSSKIHDMLVFTLDWEGAEDHCIRGYQLLNLSKKLNHLSNIVLYHHTHYDILQQLKIDYRTANLSNLIFMVDRVDALTAQHKVKENKALISISETVRNEIDSLSGSFFDPKLVEAFLKVSQKESFWFTLEEENLHRYFEDYLENIGDMDIDLRELEDVSKLFALFVDAKSPYTADHSMDVAELSKFIALKIGLDFKTCEMIKIAGLLHDLGKLKVPDELIEKEAPLSHDEFNTIKIHAYETHQILSKIKGLEEITLWASQHHETLNGTGYPYHQTKDEIPLPSRIIGAADIFQALAQNRPYRKGLKALEILNILKEKVDKGDLDQDVVKTIEDNIQQCWEISVRHSLGHI